MSNTEYDKQQLLDTLQQFEENDRNYTKTSVAMGLARSTVRDRIYRAAKTGLAGAPEVAPPPGFLVAKVTQNRKRGEILSEWVHLLPEGVTYEDVLDAVTEAVESRVGSLVTIPDPKLVNGVDLLTIYPVVDHHLGLYSWEPETGSNYDLNIATKILRDSAAELVSQAPPSDIAIVLNVGDFFHGNDDSSRTQKSKNILDTDGRYAKILDIGVDLLIYVIELALTKHKCVIVRNIPGNHDQYATVALNSSIRQAFKNNPRVHVSRDPSPFFFYRFGKVLIGSTHGDMIKAVDMPGVMAAYAPVDWGLSEHRYIYLGHVHHKSIGGGENHGAVWETFRTLAAGDAWHKQSGYAAGRSMVAITHHRDTGEKYRQTVTFAGPGFKRR